VGASNFQKKKKKKKKKGKKGISVNVVLSRVTDTNQTGQTQRKHLLTLRERGDSIHHIRSDTFHSLLDFRIVDPFRGPAIGDTATIENDDMSEVSILPTSLSSRVASTMKSMIMHA
jgi:hypothetical protein